MVFSNILVDSLITTPDYIPKGRWEGGKGEIMEWRAEQRIDMAWDFGYAKI
jgi:hypothetical protein